MVFKIILDLGGRNINKVLEEGQQVNAVNEQVLPVFPSRKRVPFGLNYVL